MIRHRGLTKAHADIHRAAVKKMKTPPCLLWYTVKPSLYTVYKAKLKTYMKNVAEPTFFFRYPLTYELKKQ